MDFFDLGLLFVGFVQKVQTENIKITNIILEQCLCNKIVIKFSNLS